MAPMRSLEPSPAELAWCRTLMRGGSRSFSAAARLLPGRTRDAATSLYAFCRVADDLIDNAAGAEEAACRIASLRARLDDACAGRPGPHPADRALAHVVHSHAIPAALLHALLDGFAWDAERRRYATLSDLTAYAVRVAGTVGAIMAVLMGVRDRHAIARAADLGVAMQFTNIARDVGEDARAGRLYLPLDWMRDAGLDEAAFLARPRHNDALACLVRRLLDEAEILYARADSGIDALPARCRPAIRAARHLYAGIGQEIARRNYDTVSARSVMPLGRKLAVLPGAFRRAGGTSLHAACLPEAAFLPQNAELLAGEAAGSRAAWIVSLFARLQAQAGLEMAGTGLP